MNDSDSGRKNLHSSFFELVKKVTKNFDGIRIEDLNCGDLLTVKTLNSTYLVKILNPRAGRVLVNGPKEVLPEPCEFCFQGSCMAEGSWLFSGWIIAGLRLEFTAPIGKTLLLSSGEEIYLNGTLLLGGGARPKGKVQ